jgi:hypothetical protein
MGPYETYVPTARQQLFHQIPAVSGWLVKGYIGALGGGKSTACEQEFIELCHRFPGGRSVATRKSAQGRVELSVLADLKRLLLPGGHAKWVATDNLFLFPNGHEAHVIPSDNPERIGSMEITHYFVQEAQEVTGSIFKTLNARLRHPAGQVNGQPYYRGLFDARGVSRGHWIVEDFIKKAWDVDAPALQRPHAENPDWVYIKSRSADNTEHLPEGYIESQIEQNKDNPAWIDVFIKGEIGIEVEGRAVYGDSFDPVKHVAEIAEDPSLRIMRGWDFGYRAPAVLWCQWTRSGRLLVLRELCPKNVSTDGLVDLALALQANEFPRRAPEFYVDYADAAGEAVQSTSSMRDLEILEERLGTAVYTRKASIESGLNVVRSLMTKTVKERGGLVPRFAVDISCTTTTSALKGSYSYPEDKLNAPPQKGGHYAATSDCLRYIAQQVVEDGMQESYTGYGSGRRVGAIGKW